MRGYILTVALWFLVGIAGAAHAETVYVKYRGFVDLAPFECRVITRSSFVRRVCYDQRERYMIIRLRNTYYHYCEIDAGTVGNLLKAKSMGHYYNGAIKGDFDCRINRMPAYR